MKTCKHKRCDNIATYGNQCQSCRNYIQRYKMTTPEVSDMLEKQQNKCLICEDQITLKKYSGVVDHCHTSGEVRGILCFTCNAAVGLIERRPFALSNIVKYVG